MDMDMYIDGEEKVEKRRFRKACWIILWLFMIGVSAILASQSMALVG